MAAAEVTSRRPSLLLVAGAAVLLAAVALYLTATSRAVGVWITPLGLGLVAAATWSAVTGRPPQRAVLVVLAVVALALLVLGLVTLVHSVTRENTFGA